MVHCAARTLTANVPRRRAASARPARVLPACRAHGGCAHGGRDRKPGLGSRACLRHHPTFGSAQAVRHHPQPLARPLLARGTAWLCAVCEPAATEPAARVRAMPRPPRRLTNAAYAPCLSACCSSRAPQAAGAAGAQPPPQSMATAFSKLRGAGELPLLLRAVIVLSVLGAHAVCGAHAALEQHPAALVPVAAETMVHHTPRALVKSLAADAAIPDGRGRVSCAWSGSPASPTRVSPPTPHSDTHGGSIAQPGTRADGRNCLVRSRRMLAAGWPWPRVREEHCCVGGLPRCVSASYRMVILRPKEKACHIVFRRT
jgi:hypothetical protein